MISLAAGDFDTIEKLDQKVAESYSKGADGMYACNFCPKKAKNPGHIREHVEIHFDGLVLNCQFCEKTFRSRNVLRGHEKRQHVDK